MDTKNTKIGITMSLVFFALMSLLMPVDLVLNTDAVFEDPAKERIKEEGLVGNKTSQLILKIKHDDDRSVSSDFTIFSKLLELEKELIDGSNELTSWDYDDVRVDKIETPFSSWSKAFESRNRSVENASKWGDLLNPVIEGGWCGENATIEETDAFKTTMLLLPKNSDYHIACPAFPGASELAPPDSKEIIWLVWLDRTDPEGKVTDWNKLSLWAEKASDNTEFEIDAVGVNMLFQKSKNIAEDDLISVVIPSGFILILVMYLIIRDLKVCAVTLGSVGLVIAAEIGIFSLLDLQISIIDAVAFPIILAVAVDGAFWYCKSSRSREEVRSLLLLALVTTLAAVSLSLFSIIKAQSSLALMMIVGIFLDWLITRYVLEDFYMSKRENHGPPPRITYKQSNDAKRWGWPVALMMLSIIALISPPGVEVFDINQFLPEDDPSLAEFEVLQDEYLIASSTVTWIIVEVDGDSHEDYLKVVNLQKQIGHHNSVISFETGIQETPLVMGISYAGESQNDSTLNSVSNQNGGTQILEDHRLQTSGETTGFIIAAFIDGSNSDAALEFLDDVLLLLEETDNEGIVGGELITGASLANDFDDSRIMQIFGAGIAVLIIALVVTKSGSRSLRIAIGTIAIGAAVDGCASLIGERGVSTAPAVLLGMGFAADYLSHASAEHRETKHDRFARWGAAITSMSVFFLLSFAQFPPARQTGQLLAISIAMSVILASCLAYLGHYYSINDSEE